MFEITRGIQQKAQKVVIYGPEGIGKSTFAAGFPNPVFIDTEGSTKHMDVARLPRPSSWQMLLAEIDEVKKARPCDTLIIDTVDWAEQLCIEALCAKYLKNGIEDFGYGNGYVYAKEAFGRFLNRLEDVIEAGMHVVLTAHAQIRKFEQPNEMGAYDRYELKLGKKTQSQTSPLVKEWADMVLFANYKTFSVAADDKGRKHKAQGGKRVMYTTHHPCWDAKNRHNLAEELPFEYGQIAHCIPILGQTGSAALQQPQDASVPPAEPEPSAAVQSVTEVEPKPAPTPMPDVVTPEGEKEKAMKALFDLMAKDYINRKQIQAAVAERGYYPADTPIENYATDFIQGVLIGAWDQLVMAILNAEVPF